MADEPDNGEQNEHRSKPNGREVPVAKISVPPHRQSSRYARRRCWCGLSSGSQSFRASTNLPWATAWSRPAWTSRVISSKPCTRRRHRSLGALLPCDGAGRPRRQLRDVRRDARSDPHRCGGPRPRQQAHGIRLDLDVARPERRSPARGRQLPGRAGSSSRHAPSSADHSSARDRSTSIANTRRTPTARQLFSRARPERRSPR